MRKYDGKRNEYNIKWVLKLAAGLLGFILCFGTVDTIARAEIYKIQINGVMHYYRDEEEITEMDYWQEAIETSWCYSYIGRATVLSDGRTLWYAANQMYYSEDEAIAGFVSSQQASGGYEKSDGTYVWYYDGQMLGSKQEYCDRYAAEHSSETLTSILTIADGTKLYCYNGKAYYSEKECYEAKGYIYTDSESEAKAAIDAWFDKGSNAEKFGLIYLGQGNVKSYYEAKAAGLSDDYVYDSFRQYTLRADANWVDEEDGRLQIKGQVFGSFTGTAAQTAESRQVAKQIADTLRGKNTYEQIKGAYEWLCNNITYDQSLNNHSVYTALITRNTVCEGYAMAFQLIMEELGIECYITTGFNHAWNVVRYDGKLYWVDATWGDQVTYINYGWLLAGTNSRWNDTYLSISPQGYYAGNTGNVGNSTVTPQPPVSQTPSSQPSEDVKAEEETSKEEITTEDVTTEEQETQEKPVTENTQQENKPILSTEDKTPDNQDIAVDAEINKHNQGFDMPLILYVVWLCVGVGVIGAIVGVVVYMKKRKE